MGSLLDSDEEGFYHELLGFYGTSIDANPNESVFNSPLHIQSSAKYGGETTEWNSKRKYQFYIEHCCIDHKKLE